MTKKIKLITAILAVVLVASGIIFYACKKEKDNNSDKNLKKEAEFVARIHEKLCVQVDVFRDGHDNVHIMTKETDNDPEVKTGIIIPNAINIQPQNAKNEEEEVIVEIPDDAIYWVVPLDGNEPENFKTGGTLTGSCTCQQGRPNCFNMGLSCPSPVERKDKYGTYLHCPSPNASNSCCQTCVIQNSTPKSVIMGSTYIVQSNTITVNGITYE